MFLDWELYFFYDIQQQAYVSDYQAYGKFWDKKHW